MKNLVLLLVAAALFAAGPAFAQEPRKGRGAQMQKQGLQPREGTRDDREFRRERMERRDGERSRLSREERDKLRQDLLDANREMKGR